MSFFTQKIIPLILLPILVGFGCYVIVHNYPLPTTTQNKALHHPATSQHLTTTLKDCSPRAWSSPQCQSADGFWMFDLFTPPEVTFVQETRQFQATPYFLNIVNKEGPFKITALKHQYYPLIFEGYYQLPSSSAVEILFFNQKTKEHIMLAYPKQEDETIQIQAFVPEHFIDETSQYVAAQVTLYDKKLGLAFILTPQVPAKTNEFHLTLKPLNTLEKTLSLTHIGQFFTLSNKPYRLKAIDYGQSLAIFEDLSQDQSFSPFITLSFKDAQTQ